MSTSWLNRVNIWEYEENSYLFLHRDQSQAVTLMQPFNCIHVYVHLMCIDRSKGTDRYETQNKKYSRR